MIRPIVQLVEERAALLDMQQSRAGLDDAIANLAARMALIRDHLTEDEWAVLGGLEGCYTGRGRAGDGQAKPTAAAVDSRCIALLAARLCASDAGAFHAQPWQVPDTRPSASRGPDGRDGAGPH